MIPDDKKFEKIFDDIKKKFIADGKITEEQNKILKDQLNRIEEHERRYELNEKKKENISKRLEELSKENIYSLKEIVRNTKTNLIKKTSDPINGFKKSKEELEEFAEGIKHLSGKELELLKTRNHFIKLFPTFNSGFKILGNKLSGLKEKVENMGISRWNNEIGMLARGFTKALGLMTGAGSLFKKTSMFAFKALATGFSLFRPSGFKDLFSGAKSKIKNFFKSKKEISENAKSQEDIIKNEESRRKKGEIFGKNYTDLRLTIENLKNKTDISNEIIKSTAEHFLKSSEVEQKKENNIINESSEIINHEEGLHSKTVEPSEIINHEEGLDSKTIKSSGGILAMNEKSPDKNDSEVWLQIIAENSEKTTNELCKINKILDDDLFDIYFGLDSIKDILNKKESSGEESSGEESSGEKSSGGGMFGSLGKLIPLLLAGAGAGAAIWSGSKIFGAFKSRREDQQNSENFKNNLEEKNKDALARGDKVFVKKYGIDWKGLEGINQERKEQGLSNLSFQDYYKQNHPGSSKLADVSDFTEKKINENSDDNSTTAKSAKVVTATPIGGGSTTPEQQTNVLLKQILDTLRTKLAKDIASEIVGSSSSNTKGQSLMSPASLNAH